MLEIKKYTSFEHPCYMDEILKSHNIEKCFPKGNRDKELWWLIKQNCYNTELCWE